MMLSSTKATHERRIEVMKDPSRIRNICVIAHVDHGKTTLSDNLIGSNSIINESMAGKIRYLDSREDEQEREITMKSSSIALLHEDYTVEQKYEEFISQRAHEKDEEKIEIKYEEEQTGPKVDYLINLIDSPGHVEFTFEVTSGLKVCDGAILVLDIFEGVCSQSITNLKKAVDNGISVILFINKIDKFMSEEGINVFDTYGKLKELLDIINAALTSVISTKIIEEYGDKGNKELLSEIFDQYSFDPLKDNVIFGSAYDGWGFTFDDFLPIICKQHGFKPKALKKFLWGDYYFHKKTKKISSKGIDDNHKPMFVDLILKNIYTIYNKIHVKKNEASVSKMAKKLGFSLTPYVLAHIDKDPQVVCKAFMSKWLPLHRAIFKMTVRKIPSPMIGQKVRIMQICRKFKQLKRNKELSQKYQKFKEAIENADKDGPLMAFVSKMNNIKVSNVNEMDDTGRKFVKKGKFDSKFYGFARIFSGTLRRGDTIKVHLLTKDSLGKKGGNQQARIEIVDVQINNIYVWMAQYLQGVQEVGPGCICALGDLGELGFKSATLSDDAEAPTLSTITFGQNLLKVSIKTEDYSDMAALAEALKKLVKADPVVNIYYDEKGDLIIETGGEVHLQRCIRDLEDYTGGLVFKVSDPIITFKESITQRYKPKRERNLVKKQKKQILKDYKKNFEEDLKKDKLIELGVEEEKEEEENDAEGEEENKMEEQEEKVEKVEEEIAPEDKEYKYFTESSSFFESTSEEEDVDHEKKAMENWVDSDEDKEDELDERFKGKDNMFLYQIKKDEMTMVTKKAKKMKIKKNLFVDIKSRSNTIELKTPNSKYRLSVQAIGMKEEFAKWLYDQSKLISKLFNSNHKRSDIQYINFFSSLEKKMIEFGTEKTEINLIMRYLISFGPAKIGNNMLLFKFAYAEDTLLGQYLSKEQLQTHFSEYFSEEAEERKHKKAGKMDYQNSEFMKEWYNGMTFPELKKSLESGFNIATQKGPLCDEEMYGSIFIVQDFKNIALNKKVREEARQKLLGKSNKKVEDDDAEAEDLKLNPQETEKKEEMTENTPQEEQTQKTLKIEEENNNEEEEEKEQESTQLSTPKKDLNSVFDTYGPISGQILGIMKQGCLESFLGAEPRLVQGLFLVTLFCEYELYGKTCEVLNKRRATILGSDYQDLTNIFIVTAHLPIQESFGFHEEMMISTSGRVIPQLAFDSWSMIEEDPFYEPTTLDELEEHGEKIFTKNNTFLLIEKIRESKGLFTDKKVVIAADKQDTIGKKR